ncbi:MAG TPA: hypothetical protein VE197_00385 [Mycobacterium sp.]|nr:hypothetical protein [Mycobacterium sp.]
MVRPFSRPLVRLGGACAALAVVAGALLVPDGGHPRAAAYPWHPKITATVFWCGEAAGPSNANISNRQSAYDLHWGRHCSRENQFYVALPYADHLDSGKLNPDNRRIPWHSRATSPRQSEMKNRWVEVQRQSGRRRITAFGQVEDVGPSKYRSAKRVSDPDYVFGPVRQDARRPITVKPKNTFGEKAGIDLSPALARYLGIKIDGSGIVSWRFWYSPQAAAIPRGPWKKVVTTSPANAWSGRG